MSYEIKGKIIAILEKRSGVTKSTGNNWFSQSYVLETSDVYPKKLCFEIFGEDRIKEANIKLQEEVTITFEIDAREYNGRWYNSFRLVTVNREEKVKEELKDLPSDFYGSDDSTPPF